MGTTIFADFQVVLQYTVLKGRLMLELLCISLKKVIAKLQLKRKNSIQEYKFVNHSLFYISHKPYAQSTATNGSKWEVILRNSCSLMGNTANGFRVLNAECFWNFVLLFFVLKVNFAQCSKKMQRWFKKQRNTLI